MTTLFWGTGLMPPLFQKILWSLISRVNGIFSNNETLPHGMYLIYLPDKNYFDLLIGNDQEFYVENDTVDFINDIILKGSDENTAFYKYQQYLQLQSKKARETQDKIRASSNPEESDQLKKDLDLLNEEVMGYINQILVDNQGNFFRNIYQITAGDKCFLILHAMKKEILLILHFNTAIIKSLLG